MKNNYKLFIIKITKKMNLDIIKKGKLKNYILILLNLNLYNT